MFPYINTNLPNNFNEYRNGSPRSNSRRLVPFNDLPSNKINCSCGSEYGEPCVCGPNSKILTPSNSLTRLPINSNSSINPFPDFNPDPKLIKFIDVNSEAIKLALYTLRISESEYASMSVEDFKRFPNTIPESYAVNILIENKKKSNLTISPIKKSSPLRHEIKSNYSIESAQLPVDELDNFIKQNADTRK